MTLHVKEHEENNEKPLLLVVTTSNRLMSVTQKHFYDSVFLCGPEVNFVATIIYHHLPLAAIRFCRLVIECNAISLLMDVAGNAPMIHHRACMDRCVRERRRRGGR